MLLVFHVGCSSFTWLHLEVSLVGVRLAAECRNVKALPPLTGPVGVDPPAEAAAYGHAAFLFHAAGAHPEAQT